MFERVTAPGLTWADPATGDSGDDNPTHDGRDADADADADADHPTGRISRPAGSRGALEVVDVVPATGVVVVATVAVSIKAFRKRPRRYR